MTNMQLHDMANLFQGAPYVGGKIYLFVGSKQFVNALSFPY